MRAQHHVGCDSKGAMHGLYVKRWYYLVYARMSAHHDVYLLYSTYLTLFLLFRQIYRRACWARERVHDVHDCCHLTRAGIR